MRNGIKSTASIPWKLYPGNLANIEKYWLNYLKHTSSVERDGYRRYLYSVLMERKREGLRALNSV